MINIYTKNNIDAKRFLVPSQGGGEYDGTIAYDIEITSNPFTYTMYYAGNGNINWGDESSDDVSSEAYTDIQHVYNNTGLFTVVLTGNILTFRAYKNSNARPLIRTIHSMSLPGYLGTKIGSELTGEFSYCSYATLSPDFKFANSILELDSTFKYCSSITSLPENLSLPPNVQVINSMFGWIGNRITVPSTFTIPNSVQQMYSMFSGIDNLKFESNFVIPSSITSIYSLFRGCRYPELSKVVLHSGLNNMMDAFSSTWHTSNPVWPTSFSSSTMNVTRMFANDEVSPMWQQSGGVFFQAPRIPPELFWEDTSKTWTCVDAFKNANHVYNYSSIPSSWK